MLTNEQNAFINTIGNAAVKHYAKYKVLPSLTIAQIIKESNWGKSGLAKTCFNYTGMKWTETCGFPYKEYNTKEWDKKQNKYITILAKFIKFPTTADGIEGHYKFIHKYKRYAPIIGETDSYTACIKMGNSGWATAPNYGQSLWKDYVLPYNLQKWDSMVVSNVQSIDIDRIAHDVIDGKYGSGEERKKNLGNLYATVQKRVNEILKNG